VIKVLQELPERQRKRVQEITLDMAPNMEQIAKRCFPIASRVTDRFHVQKLAIEALQDIRIKHRWEAIDRENEAIEHAKFNGTTYQIPLLRNGDTLRQLLARSRYVLYKKEKSWTEAQQQRAEILFENYPDLKIRPRRVVKEL
jgi:transposase